MYNTWCWKRSSINIKNNTHQEFQISNVISNTSLMCLSSKLYLENFGYHSEENNLSLGFYISLLSYNSYYF